MVDKNRLYYMNQTGLNNEEKEEFCGKLDRDTSVCVLENEVSMVSF
jgi:hypothetical protein